MLMKLIKKENPDYLACAFDSKGKTFRHEIYPDYKANRSEMPKEMQDQLVHLWEILDLMNIPVVKKRSRSRRYNWNFCKKMLKQKGCLHTL